MINTESFNPMIKKKKEISTLKHLNLKRWIDKHDVIC